MGHILIIRYEPLANCNMCNVFSKLDPTAEAYMFTLFMGRPPFLTSKKPSCTCAPREVFLNLRSGHLISASAELNFCH